MSEKKEALVVYSGRSTGNTKKVAEAIYRALGGACVIAPASDAPDPRKFDFIMLGFGVYRGWPDGDMRAYMKKCRKKDIGIFFTLGAYPDSEHAVSCMGRAEGLLDSCRIRARFCCHGRLDPAMLERMKARPAGAPHSWDPERAKRVTEAESHPDEKDLREAAEIFRDAWGKVREGVFRRREQEERKAIVLAAFGTSCREAGKAYDNIEKSVRERNPGVSVFRAYTSDMVRKKLNDGNIKSVRGTLNDLHIQGYNSVRVISLMVVPGHEHHKIVSEVIAFENAMNGIRKIEVGKALLRDSGDLQRIIGALSSVIPETGKNEAVLFMGHGNKHGTCDLNYVAAASGFEKLGRNIFLACVEGNPDFEAVREKLKDLNIKKVFLMPFMIVAGEHACNDLAGEEDDSWKSVLESDGMDCVPVLKGMGEYDEIAELF